MDVIRLIAEGKVAKEAAEKLLEAMARNPGLTAEDAAEKLGLTGLSREEIEAIVEHVIKENAETVRSRGEKAMGLLMGRVMARLRGRADGKLVASIVREKLHEFLGKS
ncbi:MAG: GatB/YqeY domain-containing protein, partial [Desulfurococcales archaeon]|nr:GatB/YqeY domain-containing protein [Desulfurococcales archaeon]